VQFELVQYQKDAPHQPQPNHLWLHICLCLVDVKSKLKTCLQCGHVCHYCAILDMYEPCMVSYWTWNDDANMNRYSCTTGQDCLMLMCCRIVMKHFCSWFLLVVRTVDVRNLTREWNGIYLSRQMQRQFNCFLTLLYIAHRIRELGQKTRNLQCQ
jgi:hypothetical protein